MGQRSDHHPGSQEHLAAELMRTLHEVARWQLAAEGWVHVEQLTQRILSALAVGDWAALRIGLIELELSGPTRANQLGRRTGPLPDRIRDRIDEITHVVGQMIAKRSPARDDCDTR